jgi:hypothetical protein
VYSNIYSCTKIFRAWREAKHSIPVVEFNQWVIRGIPRLSLLTYTQVPTALQVLYSITIPAPLVKIKPANHLINGYRFLVMCESYVITRRWSSHDFVLRLLSDNLSECMTGSRLCVAVIRG